MKSILNSNYPLNAKTYNGFKKLEMSFFKELKSSKFWIVLENVFTPDSPE